MENEIIDFDEIDVYLLNGIKRNNPKELHTIYQKTFQCWFASKQEKNSDEFTRQDDILAIFYKGECLATTFFREVNWGDETTAFDSYFNSFNEDMIQELISKGNSILISSHALIEKNYKDIKGDITWESILSGFTMKRFLESEVHAISGEITSFQNEIKVAYRKNPIHPKMDKIWDRLNRKSKSQWRLVA